ncbi:PspA/IM30 family protein [Paenibacillus amylolyticus]|nr:PspA/IM30 family protein [Paenibacillus amylolyticus]WFR60715.1 PspA/IM30 family protein [Paenibacillus amylolyticus]
MSIFKRLRDLTMSNINAIIDKAEDPIKMTDQYIRDMQEDLEDAEKAVAQQIAIEKKFKQLFEEQEALVKKREEQAHTAARAQNLDLARRALEEKRLLKRRWLSTKPATIKTRLPQITCVASSDEMRKQLTQMKNKRETLVARYNAAKAQTEINKALNGFGSDTASAGMKRMEEKMMQMEAQAEASNEMSSKGKSLDEEFEKLGKDQAVEDELAALMKQYDNKN